MIYSESEIMLNQPAMIHQRIVLISRTTKTTFVFTFFSKVNKWDSEQAFFSITIKWIFIFHYKIMNIHYKNMKNKRKYEKGNKIGP